MSAHIQPNDRDARQGRAMTAYSGRQDRAMGLTNRISERQALDRLVDGVRAGGSRTLVMRGEPGVGKTVLLDYLAGRASDAACLVTRATGVQSEIWPCSACSRRWPGNDR
jgi:hypothetical protein